MCPLNATLGQNVKAVPICCGEDRGKRKSNELLVDLCSERLRKRLVKGVSSAGCLANRSLRYKVRSLFIQEELEVELLASPIQKGQLRWLGLWLGCLLVASLMRCSGSIPPEGDTEENLGHWRGYVSLLDLERLGIPPEELSRVSEEREVWVFLLRLLTPGLSGRKRKKKHWQRSCSELVDGWMKIQRSTGAKPGRDC